MKRSLLPTVVAAPTVGGQAVIEGVMMRAKDRLAIAVRKPDGEILVELRPWFSLSNAPILRKPFVRGFPVLLETLVNGIKALNFSAMQSVDGEDGESELTSWHLVLTMTVALGVALGLFVVLPHFLSAFMQWVGLAGDVESVSFNAWDGLFKMLVFVGYIAAISLVPDIRRVFQYHGAEHKAIWTFESGGGFSVDKARSKSRLHPRCGTSFLLFVLAVSIMLHTILVPLLLELYRPESTVVKHVFVVAAKLLFMVPVSCVAYEMIRFAGKFNTNIFCRVLCWPGLALQMLTTKEPDDSQIEVAMAALKCAVREEACS
ncbi:Uncharacterized conserved protein YqhQ [Humidesulfovibrio mexicanus]|uniref:Uncharacterized conserved protein YqhQ n=1 Tax=Humidesulfovibrio mexicanus TaxID=147047 RepID=A0A238XSZ5_9BACT|nr:DUF1385 domain-containing protein [Humidesulfovibrio mexicanus]SNR61840.1 Uncharacterized conserved protein YqhQ [Humidesulfovibrio mexicanus]